VTGDRELVLISEQQEIELGKEAAAETAATVGIADNPRAAAYLAKLGQELAAKTERPKLPWRFQIADDPVVNAFALPGGFVFVTRGLMAHLNSEAQLATVVGHEIGHVTARHSVNQLSKASLAQVGLAVGTAVSDTIGQLAQLGSAGLQLLFLKYSRDHERQADTLGFRYAQVAGYDVRTMPAVFATLARVSEASGATALPTWLASHPSPDDRIQHIEHLIAERRPAPGVVDRGEYLNVIDGLVYGANPRHGYFEDGRFLHPELRFQLVVPPSWKAQNLAQALIAQATDQGAGFQLTLSPAATPSQALEQFAGQKGVSGLQPVQSPVALSSSAARFEAETESGRVLGLVTFIAHQGKTFQLLGLAPPERFDSFAPALRQIMASFAPLDDPAALAVQPARVRVVSVPAPMTFGQLMSRHPSDLSPERLAILNQVELSTRLEAGQRLKLVTGKVRQAESNVAVN
jgi:predicted Zn-dependent protease